MLRRPSGGSARGSAPTSRLLASLTSKAISSPSTGPSQSLPLTGNKGASPGRRLALASCLQGSPRTGFLDSPHDQGPWDLTIA